MNVLITLEDSIDYPTVGLRHTYISETTPCFTADSSVVLLHLVRSRFLHSCDEQNKSRCALRVIPLSLFIIITLPLIVDTVTVVADAFYLFIFDGCPSCSLSAVSLFRSSTLPLLQANF